jgi:ATP phosphoribosyltransferase
MQLLKAAGISLRGEPRQYLCETSDPNIHVIFARAKDIPVFVQFGASDLGITGHDLVLERAADVYEILDLGFGYCRLVLAAPESSPLAKTRDFEGKRIATEFPNLTRDFFDNIGKKVEIIEVHGAVESAPLIGLADAIVDLVTTGDTLRRNGLLEIETVAESSARLICNKISLRMKQNLIDQLLSRIKSAGNNYANS